MKRFFAFLLIAVLALPLSAIPDTRSSFAADPVPPVPAPVMPPIAVLSGPSSVAVNTPIMLNVSGSFAPEGFEFGVASGPGPVPISTLKTDDGSMVIGLGTAAAPGTYQFFVVAWGKATAAGRPPHAIAFITVQVGTVTPPTPPQPPVPPAADAKVTYALVVEDATTRTAATGAILGDLTFWASLPLPAPPNGGWRIYDLANPLPAGLGDDAKKAGSYPALVLYGDAKPGKALLTFIKAIPLPSTKDLILKEIK